MPDPMTDERLAEIEDNHSDYGPIPELLAEVRRLREECAGWREWLAEDTARLDRLRAELDAVRRPSVVEELVAWGGDRFSVNVARLREPEKDYIAWAIRRRPEPIPHAYGPTPTAAIEALLAAIREREGDR